MCGICGVTHFSGKLADKAHLEKMMDTLVERGPDSAGMDVRGSVGIGHRRLKIIDLSDASNQPIVDQQLGLSLVFNGAIYNYQEPQPTAQKFIDMLFPHAVSQPQQHSR